MSGPVPADPFARIESIGWRAQVFLEQGIARTYPWVAKQVRTGARGQTARTLQRKTR